jgi:hypothetical protein
MKKENRIKLEIEKLKSHSDYCKFEIGQFNLYFIAIISLVIAIFIPLMISLGTWYWPLIIGVVLFTLLKFAHKKINPQIKINTEKIKKYSKKINRLYEELGIK